MSASRGVRACLAAALLVSSWALVSCGSADADGGGDDVEAKAIPATSLDYVAFAWNDLGMHCLNPTYDKAVLLPPYNTLWVQVVKRGAPPEIVTAGITVEYAIRDNTYSYGKRDYGQFWDNCSLLFGTALVRDTGLNLVDPGIHNGLSGTMVVKGDHFQADGIPVVPVDDASTWDPYQVADITVRDSGTNAVLVQTRATVPTSDEINCGRCHGADPLLDVLEEHDEEAGTTLAADRPVLCASCHGSPALGTSGPGSSGYYLSRAIHGSHSSRGAVCYDCHPGPTTKCSRSTAHTTADGNCVACHGTMADVASSIATGSRVPWVQEPACATCHAGVAEVATGTFLYRNASGHNGVSCPACHGSPHAQLPTSLSPDGFQAAQYQTDVRTIGSCKVCHGQSKGEGIDEFTEAHGGDRATACSVCHTIAPSATASRWPHQFQWKSR